MKIVNLLFYKLTKNQICYSKYIVGADGVYSTVRKSLHIPFEGY